MEKMKLKKISLNPDTNTLKMFNLWKILKVKAKIILLFKSLSLKLDSEKEKHFKLMENKSVAVLAILLKNKNKKYIKNSCLAINASVM